MEKAKDGVTLIADAIRAEMKQAEEKAKQQATPPANVIDVTAQFQNTPPKANLGSVYGSTVNATPPNADTGNNTPPADMSNNSDTSNKGNDDGTIFKNE